MTNPIINIFYFLQQSSKTIKVHNMNIQFFVERYLFLTFFNILLLITDEIVGEVVIPPSKKLEDLIRLAELCVDLLRQNEEFYAEVK